MSIVKNNGHKKWLADIAYQQADLTSNLHQDIAALYPNLLRQPDFPSADELTKLIADIAPKFATSGRKFILQEEGNSLLDELGYEGFINQTAHIPTRDQNWHDFFNALIWGLFPASKQAINQLHVSDIQQHGLKKRTKQRDALTLFDECGVVLAYSDETQKHALVNHLWLQSFWHNRSDWFNTMRPFVFGHAMYEMALAPYIGLTAKAYFIKVNKCFFNESLANQYHIIDVQLAEGMLANKTLANNTNLSPLPILGVPSWYDANTQKSFYLNTDYFRPKRVKLTTG